MRDFNPYCPLAPEPFALSLSKGRSWFDKLTTNGGVRSISPNGQSGINIILKRICVTFVVLTLWAPAYGNAAPYRPGNDAEILEHLPLRPGDTLSSELHELRVMLQRNPENLMIAAQLARRYIERARVDSDPRFLGYAQSALAPWWSQAQPPLDALVLRAIIRSSLHEFDAALADLSLALQRQPNHAQARFSRASLFQLRGQYADAQRDCMTLMRSGIGFTAYACLTSATSLTGQAEKSYTLLHRISQQATQATSAEKQWMHGLLAEMAARRGDVKSAETHFREVFDDAEPDAYLLAAYADFLLDRHRPREVVALLADKTRADGLLLRLTIAEQKLNAPSLIGHIEELNARFAAARLRGDTRHLREEARFLLSLKAMPAEALRLAQQNWMQQREPADVRLFLEAASAARAPHAAQPVLDWLAKTHLEDVSLIPAKAALKKVTS